MKFRNILLIALGSFSFTTLLFSQQAISEIQEKQLHDADAEASSAQADADSQENILPPAENIFHHYRIANAQYISTGSTKVFALERTVPINKKLVFASKEQLESYLDDIKQSLENTRLLAEIDIQYQAHLPDAEGIIPVDVVITVSDSKHLLGLPKPSYDSNTGAELKLKFKDTNFLGFMNTLNFDFNGRIGDEDNPWDITDSNSKPPFIFGINFDYELPFNIGPTRNSWSHDFSFDWTIGKNKPEFRYATGLTVGIPFAQNTLNLNFTQSIVRDDKYYDLGDVLYFVEEGTISMPLTIGVINNITPVQYTPSFNVSYNWDLDKINPANKDLRGPTISINQTLSTDAVNWIGNMRTGYFLSGSQSFGWNFYTQTLIPQIMGEVKLYKSFKYIGIATDIYFYAMLNSSQNTLGARLRGILDNQCYQGTEMHLLKTDSALQLSFDLPVHIITTDWLGWGAKLFGPYEALSKTKQKLFWLPHKLGKYLDFELQISPFFDLALIKNQVTNRYFSPKDGFYDAGVEILVFPAQWKSFVVRASIGFDMSRILLKDILDMSYRDTSVKPYELFIGLGLQF